MSGFLLLSSSRLSWLRATITISIPFLVYLDGTKEGVTYVLITKKQLRNVAETIEVGQLTEYIVMDIGGR